MLPGRGAERGHCCSLACPNQHSCSHCPRPSLASSGSFLPTPLSSPCPTPGDLALQLLFPGCLGLAGSRQTEAIRSEQIGFRRVCGQPASRAPREDGGCSLCCSFLSQTGGRWSGRSPVCPLAPHLLSQPCPRRDPVCSWVSSEGADLPQPACFARFCLWEERMGREEEPVSVALDHICSQHPRGSNSSADPQTLEDREPVAGRASERWQELGRDQ